MKRLIILFVAVICSLLQSYAGGIVTNTNHSAAWVRMPVRDASVAIDAAFYNPAGLTELTDGFHFLINNQTLKQSREIVNDYPWLNDHSYKGDVFVPALPSLFVAYKKGKLAISAAALVIGGGGSAEYKRGLPSFETSISALPKSLTAKGINTSTYNTDISFDGSSVYWGFQLAASYKINEFISVAAGGRYVLAKNTYKGHIKDIRINPIYPSLDPSYDGVNMIPATELFTKLAAKATTVANSLSGFTNNDATKGQTLDQLVTNGLLPSANAEQLKAGLGSAYNSAMTISQVQYAYNVSAATSTGTATALADKDVDVEQTGHGFTPIFGVNLLLLDKKLDVALKFEGKTNMTVKNKTTKDDVKMFPDGKAIKADMPAQLAVGVSYKIVPAFTVYGGLHYYFDRDADYGKVDSTLLTSGKYEVHKGNDYFIDKNTYEIALGFEYQVSEKLLLSVGYLYGSTSPTLAYQSDLSYTLSSNNIGFGGNLTITPRFNVDLGLLYTAYKTGDKMKDYGVSGLYKETYYKYNVIGSIGLNIRLGGN